MIENVKRVINSEAGASLALIGMVVMGWFAWKVMAIMIPGLAPITTMLTNDVVIGGIVLLISVVGLLQPMKTNRDMESIDS